MAPRSWLSPSHELGNHNRAGSLVLIHCEFQGGGHPRLQF
jgi:hypothetical protein